mgnify:CR=1 FL=1
MYSRSRPCVITVSSGDGTGAGALGGGAAGRESDGLLSSGPGKKLFVERGFDRRGSDYVDFRARDLFDCKDSCRRDERCRAYTFDTVERTCWLKSRVNSQQRDRDMVTGYKQ